MSYFDLDPTVEANTLAKLGTIKPGDMGPGPAAGVFKGAGLGLAQNIATPAALLADAATPALMPFAVSIDQVFGGTSVRDWLLSEQQKTRRAVADLMPGPDVGTLGQLAFGASQIVPQAIAGGMAGGPGGAAALPATLQGYQANLTQLAQGVDPETAAGVGAITGVTTAAAVAMPATIGGRLLPTLTVGAGANVAQGVVTRGATRSLLEARGYKDMARQYQAFDAEQMLTDAVLGVALGGVALGLERAAGAPAAGAPTPRTIPPTAIDEALSAQHRLHADVPTAPGVPVDPLSRTAHAQALAKAVEDLANDRPVDVSATGIADAEFVPNRARMQASVEAAVVDLSPLGKLLNEVDTLRAEVEAAGLKPADDPLFTGRQVGEDPARGPLTPGEMPQEAPRLPGAVEGRAGEVFVGERAEPVRFVLVDAGTLGATVAKADNQFRDRTRVASLLQIAKIANDLQFGRLGEAPTMAEGAPTLAADGRVVGGNGRVLAIQRAYDQGTAAGYRAALAERAAEFGLTREQVEAMDRPVLVRQFTGEVDVRQAAILSNEGGALRMSALEQAKVDAERMPSLTGVEMPDSGDFTAASMRDFVRQWISRYPQAEQGNLIAQDGRLSAEGVVRLRNSVLFEAYGDSPTLARLVESTDERQKNIAAALVKAAPTVAEARALIEVGSLHDLDVQPHLLEAVGISQRLRAEGTRLDDFLNQTDAFADPVAPEAVAFLRHFEANPRSQRAIAEAITGYYDAVRSLGDPKQASMFDAEPPSRAQLLQAVLKGMPVDPVAMRQAERAAAPEMGRLEPAQRDVLLGLYEKAEGEKAAFDAAVVKVAQAFRGEAKLAPLKGVPRATEKIAADYAGQAGEIKDLLRATIEVDSVADARLVIEQIKQDFDVLPAGQRDLLDPATFSVDGYRDAKFNVRRGDVVAELQVNLPEMLEAKKVAHDLYKARSEIERAFGYLAKNATPEQLAEIDRLNVAMREVYDPAFARAQSRASVPSIFENAAGDTGAPLRRADSGGNGRGGTRSQASEYPPQKLPSETGIPSTSKNSTPGAENTVSMTTSGDIVPPGAEIATRVGQIMADMPNAQALLDDGSTVPAGVALASAEAKISTTQTDAEAFPAAVACALRG